MSSALTRPVADPERRAPRASKPPSLAQPSRVDGGRLSDRLALALQAQIEQGQYAIGSRLPTEMALAATHKVSRTVVREAVHQLKSQGLVQSRQGSGVFVAHESTRHAFRFDPKVLSSLDDVVQMVELRRVVEGEIAALAAERATSQHKLAIRHALYAIDAATQAGQLGVDEDMAFHRLIGEATGNAQFVRLLAMFEVYLRDAMTVTKTNEARRADHMAQVRREHAAIAQAIDDGDPLAARSAVILHHGNGEVRLIDSGVIEARDRPRVVLTAPS
jgi:GntR family transcriptional regulator, transcriptional repressor for pyruvate dehydrogenase complex